MSEPEEYSNENEKYIDWLGDNKSDCKNEFIEMHEDEFSEYCKKRYNEDEDIKDTRAYGDRVQDWVK